MKSNQNENPPTVSAPNPRDNPCLGSGPNIAALEIFADDGISYLLPYAQFLYAERIANPALGQEPDAPPEKMLIHFVMADVVVLGSGLKTLERVVQKYELKFVKSVDRRLATSLTTHIAAVTVTLATEKI
jgi:hypothetical protein